MKNLIEKIEKFLVSTGIPASRLAKEANVSSALLSRVLNGKQSDIFMGTANSLELAMHNLSKDTTHAT